MRLKAVRNTFTCLKYMRKKDGKILVVESKVRTIPAYDTYTHAYMHQVGKQYAIQKEMRKEEVLSFRKNEKY